MDLTLTLTPTLELNIQISEFILKMVTLYDENIACIDTLEPLCKEELSTLVGFLVQICDGDNSSS